MSDIDIFYLIFGLISIFFVVCEADQNFKKSVALMP